MPRRSNKTVNIPTETAQWIDELLGKPGNKPLGIQSRDEFVRVAIGLLAAGISPKTATETVLDRTSALVRDWRIHHDALELFADVESMLNAKTKPKQ